MVISAPPLSSTHTHYFFAPHVSTLKEQGMGTNVARQRKKHRTYFHLRPKREFNCMWWVAIPPDMVSSVPSLFFNHTQYVFAPYVGTVKEQGVASSKLFCTFLQQQQKLFQGKSDIEYAEKNIMAKRGWIISRFIFISYIPYIIWVSKYI